RRRHTRFSRDWSSDVCSSDLIRSDDARFAGVVAPLDHAPTHSAIAAERAMLAVLDGSCRTPVGALTTLSNGTISLKGEILSLDRSEERRVGKGCRTGRLTER